MYDKPFFIVGFPRSGTTMLASIFSRHSKIAIPPETRFFAELTPRFNAGSLAQYPKKEMIAKALSNQRVSDLCLSADDLAESLNDELVNNRDLLGALLGAYAEKQGKSCFGEKSPVHLLYIPEIIGWYPEAKIVAIVRDGRDSVLSLLKTPWANKNPLRQAAEWNYRISVLNRMMERFSKNIIVIRYEDLLEKPEEEISRICSFLRVEFEDSMLSPGDSNVVPEWEKEWKSKAADKLDSSRVSAWKQYSDKDMINNITLIMRHQLVRWGYVVSVKELPVPLRLKFWFFYSPQMYSVIRLFREKIKDLASLVGVEHWITRSRIVANLKTHR